MRGQVESFEMLMVAAIMVIVMGMVLPNLIGVKELVLGGEQNMLEQKYLSSIASKVEKVYLMGSGSMLVQEIDSAEGFSVFGSGNEIRVGEGVKEVRADLSAFACENAKEKVVIENKNGLVTVSCS
jgi:hypothetical protein